MMQGPKSPQGDEEFFRSVGGTPVFRSSGEAHAEEAASRITAWYFGWIPRRGDVEAFFGRRSLRLFSEVGESLADSGAGRTILLYQAVRDVWDRDLDPGPQ